jgi:hypothetical protein
LITLRGRLACDRRCGLLHLVRDQLVALVEEQDAKLLLLGKRPIVERQYSFCFDIKFLLRHKVFAALAIPIGWTKESGI